MDKIGKYFADLVIQTWKKIKIINVRILSNLLVFLTEGNQNETHSDAVNGFSAAARTTAALMAIHKIITSLVNVARSMEETLTCMNKVGLKWFFQW